jgi:hypothetical protein
LYALRRGFSTEELRVDADERPPAYIELPKISAEGPEE